MARPYRPVRVGRSRIFFFSGRFAGGPFAGAHIPSPAGDDAFTHRPFRGRVSSGEKSKALVIDAFTWLVIAGLILAIVLAYV
jgi:hypothetical protein